jgi:hypothetical protein
LDFDYNNSNYSLMLIFTVTTKLLQLLVYPDIQVILFELRALETFYIIFFSLDMLKFA